MSNHASLGTGTGTNTIRGSQVLVSTPALLHRRASDFKDILLSDLDFVFGQAGKSLLTPSAYDTAWVARLSVSEDNGNGGGNGNYDKAPLFPGALAWLVEHQHPDGSWGNGGVLDRLMPTLAALIALRTHSRWLVANEGNRNGNGSHRRGSNGSRGNSNGNHSSSSSNTGSSNHHLEAGVTYIWSVASHLANGTGPLALAVGDDDENEGQVEDANAGESESEDGGGTSGHFGQPVQPVILPVAFELVLSTLLEDALALGLNLPPNLADRYEPYRQEKLKKLSEVPPSHLKNSSAVYSLEFCGSNLPAPPETLLHHADGGVGVSVAATAWLYLHTPPEQVELRERMYRFLLDNRIPDADGANNSDGGSSKETASASAWPVITCIDTFEWIWAYYNLHLWLRQRRANGSGSLAQVQTQTANYRELEAEVQHCLSQLYQCWSKEVGLGTASRFLPDSDSTAMAYLVLQESGYTHNHNHNQDVTLDALAPYWREPGYLVTYAFERDPSTSANIHALEALTVAGRLADANLIVAFLEEQRRGRGFWQDKWHISPYYPTSHALIAYCRLNTPTSRATARLVARWIVQSQNLNGSWGWETRLGTMEETAYTLQALIVYAETYGWSETDDTDDAATTVPASTFAATATTTALLTTAKAGADYLRREYRPYVWEPDTLWISKTRYSPFLVVRSAVLSALLMAEEHRL
jgi:hypothetical protein